MLLNIEFTEHEYVQLKQRQILLEFVSLSCKDNLHRILLVP